MHLILIRNLIIKLILRSILYDGLRLIIYVLSIYFEIYRGIIRNYWHVVYLERSINGLPVWRRCYLNRSRLLINWNRSLDLWLLI